MGKDGLGARALPLFSRRDGEEGAYGYPYLNVKCQALTSDFADRARERSMRLEWGPNPENTCSWVSFMEGSVARDLGGIMFFGDRGVDDGDGDDRSSDAYKQKQKEKKELQAKGRTKEHTNVKQFFSSFDKPDPHDMCGGERSSVSNTR